MYWDTVFRKARENEIDRVAAVRMRVRYLLQEIEVCEQANYDEDIMNMVIQDDYDEIYYLFGKIKRTEVYTENITDEDIERAKEHPIENLIELDSRGKAIAWCHDDKNASMTLWKGKNRVRCWACSKTYNPIDILVERDGLTFIEAVKRLSQ